MHYKVHYIYFTLQNYLDKKQAVLIYNPFKTLTYLQRFTKFLKKVYQYP